MEVIATFWQLPKNYNSTKQPNNTTHMNRSVNITVKDDTDILNPEIMVDTYDGLYFPSDHNPDDLTSRRLSNYTHVYIGGLNRYYHIVNIVYNSVNATIKLSVDVLTTYKNGIVNSQQLVARNQTRFNGKITDEQTVCNGKITTLPRLSTQIFTPGEDAGSIVIGTLDGSQSSFGTVTYYRLAKLSDLDDLKKELFSDVEWLQISDVSAEMTKALVNPLQYFVSCKQFPFKVWSKVDGWTLLNSSGLPTRANANKIRFGFWESETWAWRMPAYDDDSGVENVPFMWTCNGTLSNIHKHPQAASYGEYLNLAPYSTYTLNFEPFGQIAIDPAKLYGCNSIDLYVQVDIVTGAAVLTISAMEPSGSGYVDRLISKHYANVAIDHVLSQTTTDVLGVATKTATTTIDVAGHVAAAAHPGNLIDGDSMRHVSSALTTAISGASDIYRNSFPQSSRQGSLGNHFVAAKASLVCEFKEVNPVPAERVGKPLCEFVSLSTCSGFTRCINPQYTNDPTLNNVCTLEEQHKILSFMEEGFIIE